MIYRCYDSTRPGYELYGGRGISICDEWRDDPTSFLTWCDSQEPIQDGYSLDRIDNEGNYEAENCRFVSKEVQGGNRRDNIMIEHNGETLCLMAFFKKYGLVSYDTMMRRVHDGMSHKDAAIMLCDERRRDCYGKFCL